jgi:CRP-like cAMP-binding protein
MSPDSQSPANQLLARLPPAEYQRLQALMQPVTLELKQIIYQVNGLIEYVYFLTRGTASALTVMEDGTAIEVATIGREGVVGVGAMFAGKTSRNKVEIQIAGEALRIGITALEDEVRLNGQLRSLLAAYQTALFAQVSQSVACNGLHSVQQRCCRWLLMTRDRVDSDEIPLTHDYLAIMLGVRRASVTDVLGLLSDQGVLSTSRGAITILNRNGLERFACECFRKVKEEFDRLLG